MLRIPTIARGVGFVTSLSSNSNNPSIARPQQNLTCLNFDDLNPVIYVGLPTPLYKPEKTFLERLKENTNKILEAFLKFSSGLIGVLSAYLIASNFKSKSNPKISRNMSSEKAQVPRKSESLRRINY
jgi:hypothetical protein